MTVACPALQIHMAAKPPDTLLSMVHSPFGSSTTTENALSLSETRPLNARLPPLPATLPPPPPTTWTSTLATVFRPRKEIPTSSVAKRRLPPQLLMEVNRIPTEASRIPTEVRTDTKTK